PYARRSKSLDKPIPILYLKGVSTGDFASAFAGLLGKDALGLWSTTIARLKEVWIDVHKRWSERDLSGRATSTRLRLGRRRLPAGASGIPVADGALGFWKAIGELDPPSGMFREGQTMRSG